MAFVPFLGDKYKALAFVILYGALNFPGSIGNYMWQSFFADIFRPNLRAKVLSLRNIFATVAGTVTTLAAGFLLSLFSSSNDKLIHFYQVVFVLAFIIGSLEVVSLVLHREDKNASYREVTTEGNSMSIGFLKIMIKQKGYVVFMICVMIFNFTWQMGWPLFLTYEVDYLHTNEMWSAILATASGICSAFGFAYWRKFSEKRGTALALTVSSIGLAINPILEAMTNHISQILYFNGIIGFANAGLNLVLLNSLYEVAPRENRTSYIAFYNLATNITLVIAPWAGMQIYKFVDIRTSLVIVGILRLLASGIFFIRQRKQKPVLYQA
jgi:MFS family permease